MIRASNCDRTANFNARKQTSMTADTAESPQGSPVLTVIVPCRNEADAIDEFLDCVLDQEGVPGEYEVIIADGSSDDGTLGRLQERARREPRLSLIENPERFVSSGLNRAIVSAKGETIVRMDVHTVYARDYLASCLRVLESTGAANVGGAARTRSGTTFQAANAAAFHSWFSVGGARFHDVDYTGEVDTVPFGCWRRKSLLAVGLYDESLVRNQDDELNLRLTKSGGRIWQDASIRLWYSPRDSLKGLFRQYFQYGYWKVVVLRKHRMPAAWRHLVPIAAILTGLGLAVAGFVLPFAWWTLGVLSLAYLALLLLASLQATVRARRLSLFPLFPGIFLTYHLSYGMGFALGLFDILLGRSPSSASFSAARR